MLQMSPLFWKMLFIMTTIGALMKLGKNYFYLESVIKNNKSFSISSQFQNN